MKGYVQRLGIAKAEAEDLVSDAWRRALETYNPSFGLDPVQWAWHILQYNMLPQHWRRQEHRRSETTLEDDPPDDSAQALDARIADEQEPERFIAFLRANLPPDLLKLLDAMMNVLAETNSRHIYEQVASQLNISMPKCRNMVKRLKRVCTKLRKLYNQ
jgi:DNA-directed RNA polymerase specialized sigma24 family protein